MAHEEFRPKDFDGALAHLIEECGEVLAAAGKTLRYGLASVNPLIPVEQRETNGSWLKREMEDLRLSLESLLAKLPEEYV